MKRLLCVALLSLVMGAQAKEAESSPLKVDFDEVSVQTVKPGSVTEGMSITELAPTKSELKAKKTDFNESLRREGQIVGEGL